MKYVAYYRVSTKRQNLGLDAQRNTVTNYINNIGGRLIVMKKKKAANVIIELNCLMQLIIVKQIKQL